MRALSCDTGNDDGSPTLQRVDATRRLPLPRLAAPRGARFRPGRLLRLSRPKRLFELAGHAPEELALGAGDEWTRAWHRVKHKACLLGHTRVRLQALAPALRPSVPTPGPRLAEKSRPDG